MIFRTIATKEAVTKTSTNRKKVHFYPFYAMFNEIKSILPSKEPTTFDFSMTMLDKLALSLALEPTKC